MVGEIHERFGWGFHIVVWIMESGVMHGKTDAVEHAVDIGIGLENIEFAREKEKTFWMALIIAQDVAGSPGP